MNQLAVQMLIRWELQQKARQRALIHAQLQDYLAESRSAPIMQELKDAGVPAKIRFSVQKGLASAVRGTVTGRLPKGCDSIQIFGEVIFDKGRKKTTGPMCLGEVRNGEWHPKHGDRLLEAVAQR